MPTILTLTQDTTSARVRYAGNLNIDAICKVRGGPGPETPLADRLQFVAQVAGDHLVELARGEIIRETERQARETVEAEHPRREWERDTSTPPRENGERT